MVKDIFANQFLINLFLLITLIIILIFLLDVIFLKLYKVIKKSSYIFIKKVPIKNIFFESHPYLPYVIKKKIICEKRIVNYPLNNIQAPKLVSNEKGFFNGENGNKRVVIPKPKNLIRINCIGASTTGNYIEENNKIYSYPLELERILKKKYPKKKIEVNNFGIGGYNSADILISSILSQIDTKPNYVIIYHAYNDIRSYLTGNFSSDYSHSRENLAQNLNKIKNISWLPDLPISFYNFIINKFFVGTDLRNSIHNIISKGKINIHNDYKEGLKIYERNMNNLINIYKSSGCDVVICKFCFYFHKEIKNDKIHRVYKKIVFKENIINKNLAKKFHIKFVNTDYLLKNSKENFLDTIHFSVIGMRRLARLIANSIKI